MDPYISEYAPGSTITPDLKNFIKHYYQTVDTNGSYQEYANCFTENVLLTTHGKVIKGREGMAVFFDHS